MTAQRRWRESTPAEVAEHLLEAAREAAFKARAAADMAKASPEVLSFISAAMGNLSEAAEQAASDACANESRWRRRLAWTWDRAAGEREFYRLMVGDVMAAEVGQNRHHAGAWSWETFSADGVLDQSGSEPTLARAKWAAESAAKALWYEAGRAKPEVES